MKKSRKVNTIKGNMVFYLESRSTDPRRNLALEQFVFDRLDRRRSYIMLWQNDRSVIVGKNQNTAAEINSAFVNAHNISVVRRLSGGGAVYHDLGNLNFTFITDAASDKTIDCMRRVHTPPLWGVIKGMNPETNTLPKQPYPVRSAAGLVDFAEFCRPVQKALLSLGVPAEVSGRNDMTVQGKKISGNAQYIKQGRVMHHGTLLYDSDLDMLRKALKPNADKMGSKGVKSVKSRVSNIRPYMKTDMPIKDFRAALKDFLAACFDMKEYCLTAEDEIEVARLNERIYSQWSWNYGASPPHNIRKTRRIEGCGKIEILLDVGKEGVINNLRFYGDFFGSDDAAMLAEILKGRHFEYNETADALRGINISRFFHNLDEETFLSMLFE